MEKENNKLKFTLIWSSCVCVLLLMFGLGVGSSIKGTSAINDSSTCPDGYSPNEEGSCCKTGYQLADGVCCPSGYSYYSGRWGIGTQGCYKVSLWSYTHIPSTNICEPNFSDVDGDEISNCYTSSYHEPVDVVARCEEGNILNEDGKCVEDTTNDDKVTEDGNTTNDPSNQPVEQCWKCNNSEIYHFGTASSRPDNGCIWVVSNKDKENCVTSEPVEQCWKCNNSEIYHFGTVSSRPDNGCIWVVSTKDKENCVTSEPDEPNDSPNNYPNYQPNTPPATTPSVDTPSEDTPSVDTPSSETNVDGNPQTGEIAIFVVWVIAAAAIVYSVWYFKRVRES